MRGMDWGKLLLLVGIILIGYAPYKAFQRFNKHGLNDISYLTSVLLTLWFIIWSVLLFVWSQITRYPFSTVSLVVFFITTMIWIFAPGFIRKFGVVPARLISEKPTWFGVRFDRRTFYLKYFEVIFQQAKFLFLLSVIFAVLPYASQIIWFVLAVGFLHFQNIFFIPRGEAVLFFVLSFPGAFLFSYFILHGQFLLSISFHLWFYLIFCGLPWFQKKYAALPAR